MDWATSWAIFSKIIRSPCLDRRMTHKQKGAKLAAQKQTNKQTKSARNWQQQNYSF
jgi:hypothetical protein